MSKKDADRKEADRIVRELSEKGTLQAEKDYLKKLDEKAINYHYEKPLTCDYKGSSYQIFSFSIALSCFDFAPGQLFLDFGAGPCWITEWLNRMGLSVVAFDINFEFMALGKRRMGLDSRIKKECLKGFVTGNSEYLPFRARTFDGIICFDTLHHMRDDKSVLAEAYRILNPGGKIVIIEPGPYHAIGNIDYMKKSGILERGVDSAAIMKIAKEIGFYRTYIKPYVHPDVLRFSQSEWTDFRQKKSRIVSDYIDKIIYNIENNRSFIVLEKLFDYSNSDDLQFAFSRVTSIIPSALDFASDSDFPFLDGWHARESLDAEKDFRWTQKNFVFFLKPSGSEMRLEVYVPIRLLGTSLTLSANGIEIYRKTLWQRGWQLMSVELPEDLVNSAVLFQGSLEKSWVPIRGRLKISADTRQLGIGVAKVET